MRLSKADGEIILGAIGAEIESQHWRQMRRSSYGQPLPGDVEDHVRQTDAKRKAELQEVARKIREQL